MQVEYREKLYAVGRIPSTYNKREGTAKEHEVLAARRIDRALRPLFPRGYALDAAVSAQWPRRQAGQGLEGPTGAPTPLCVAQAAPGDLHPPLADALPPQQLRRRLHLTHTCLLVCLPQVFASVLSADGAADPDVLAICAASAALQCSPLPWAGPVGAARAALLPGGELVVSPSVEQQEAAALNLLVACTADRVTMLEAEGDQVGRACPEAPAQSAPAAA